MQLHVIVVSFLKLKKPNTFYRVLKKIDAVCRLNYFYRLHKHIRGNITFTFTT